MSGIYVLEFSDGTLKVGRSNNCAHRIETHRKNAATFGIKVEQQWTSKAHVNTHDTEAALVAYCHQRAKETIRVEWFHGLEFSKVVAHAETLNYDTNFTAHAREKGQRAEALVEAMRGFWGQPEKLGDITEQMKGLVHQTHEMYAQLDASTSRLISTQRRYIQVLENLVSEHAELLNDYSEWVDELQAELALARPTR